MGLLMLNESVYKRAENTGSAHFQKICVYCYFLSPASLITLQVQQGKGPWLF